MHKICYQTNHSQRDKEQESVTYEKDRRIFPQEREHYYKKFDAIRNCYTRTAVNATLIAIYDDLKRLWGFGVLGKSNFQAKLKISYLKSLDSVDAKDWTQDTKDTNYL